MTSVNQPPTGSRTDVPPVQSAAAVAANRLPPVSSSARPQTTTTSPAASTTQIPQALHGFDESAAATQSATTLSAGEAISMMMHFQNAFPLLNCPTSAGPALPSAPIVVPSIPVAAAEMAAQLTSPVDLCVITVVQAEFQACCKVFEHVTKKKMKATAHLLDVQRGVAGSATPLSLSGFEVDWKGLKIALLLQRDMGSEDTIDYIHDISRTDLKSAKVIAMVGCCAGAKDKVNLGDLLTPVKIAVEAGKQKSGKDYSADAKLVELSTEMKGIVKFAAAAAGNDYLWEKYIPKDYQNLPSPLLLLDTILAKVIGLSGRAITKGKIAEEIFKDHPEWQSENLNKPVVVSAIDKLMVANPPKIAEKKSGGFRATKEGKVFAKKVGDTGIHGFPPKRHVPVICTDTTFTINIVSENFDFEQERKKQGQRKIIGIDMEGYGFLHGVQKYLPQCQAIFIKGVSDLATSDSKMDYYQHYCAASAAAYLCHILKENDYLFSEKESKSAPDWSFARRGRKRLKERNE